MESNHQCPVPTNSNRERASNIPGEEFLSKESYRANNKPVITYHRRYPDGKFIPVMLSPSYGFCPEDDELIMDYLIKEINKEEAPYNRIPKVNVYKHTPEKLAELHQSLRKDEWCFYSSRDRKYFNGSRPNRAAADGFWKATGADKKIYRDGKFIGSKKCLVFHQGKPKQSNKTTWIMHEYVADLPQRCRLPNGTDDMRLDECVLCRIYKKSENSPKEEKGAATSQCGETAEPAACKSSENKKQVAPMRVKTEHKCTNQQQNLPVIQPSLPTQQQNLQVLQLNHSMSQWNQHTMHYRFWRNNLGRPLDFHPERNPKDAQPIMLQPNLERASNMERASTPEEVSSKESYGPNNKLVISYHRRYPDGKYVAVILSPGFGFIPEDNELIVDYLIKEINKEEAPYNRIPKVNVYNHAPEKLAELHQSLGKDEWYLYSSRDRKYLNGSRPNRAAGDGFWKATGADKIIYRDGKSVGSKKCLVFYLGKPKQSYKTTWIMHEYVAALPQRHRFRNGIDDMRLDDCVLCRIYKKSEYSPKEEKGAAASQSGETAANPAAPKSSENKEQASSKRAKTEHEGTNQQHNLTYPPLFKNGFRYDDLYPLSSLYSFDPIPPSLYNNDHPQNGSLIQRDELVFPKAVTSGKAYNPREKS